MDGGKVFGLRFIGVLGLFTGLFEHIVWFGGTLEHGGLCKIFEYREFVGFEHWGQLKSLDLDRFFIWFVVSPRQSL